jgi:AbrB family looped-hinge helix DNA binding protein
MRKGRCMRKATVYGLSTVSDKGQIAIPINIRRELNLKKGDKLMIIKRSDNSGFSFIRMDLINRLMEKVSKDENFFENAAEEAE